MKNTWVCFVLTVSCVIAAGAQDKPRVFVQGKGSEDVQSSGSGAGGNHWATWGSRSTMDSHDESMEVTKDLQKNCSSVTVTLNQTNADYTVLLNRESKKNRGLLRSNSQVEVANRAGDILGTNATHTVGNAAKDACQLIAADWQTHGRQPSAEPAPAAAAAPKPAAQPSVQPVAQTQPTATLQSAQVVTVSDPAPAPAASDASANNSASLADAARQAKQHSQCLELAKDNPSIVCK
jgi:hypothetical protein